VSYALQNLSSLQSTLRINPKLRASFTCRNVPVIFFLLFNSTRLFNLNSSSLQFRRQLIHYSDVSFLQFGSLVFKELRDIKYEPIGTNYALSAYRVALTLIDNYLFGLNIPSPAILCTPRSFVNPYFQSTSLFITPSSKQSFSSALHKFLRMILHLWFTWPGKYTSVTTHTFITPSTSVLRFLNLYYFKVYRI
jgi:hypothetical protein